MPVLNLDAVAPQTLDVQKGERLWKLRMDVPSSRLVRCFALVEMEGQRPELSLPDPTTTAPGAIDFAALRAMERELRAHEELVEAETLAVLGDIWRWSDPEVRDEQIGEWLTPGERRNLVQLFFLGLLARSGKLPRAVTSASSPTDSPAQPAVSGRAPQRQTPTAESSPSSMAPDSTPSATHSPAASSSSPQPRRRQRQIPRTEPRTAARSTS